MISRQGSSFPVKLVQDGHQDVGVLVAGDLKLIGLAKSAAAD